MAPYLKNSESDDDRDGEEATKTTDAALDAFLSKTPHDQILELTNLPPKSDPSYVIDLFASSLGLPQTPSPNQIIFPTLTTALVNRSSATNLQNTLNSKKLRIKLNSVKDTLVILPCERQDVFDEYTGWTNDRVLWKKGDKLLIHGDLPNKDFFLSHYDCLVIKNYDPKVSKKDVAKALQPYCEEWRDVNGSMHVVTCHKGFPTGIAYVGFDRPGEMSKVLAAIKAGELNFGCDDFVILPVIERRLRGIGEKQPMRSERTETELLDCLQNWEKHVDPALLKEVIDSGAVTWENLNDTFIHARYKNKSFGLVDLARKGEKLEPELPQGHNYARFVSEYIERLKEMTPTKENPGYYATCWFKEGEEVDLDLINSYKRQEPPKLLVQGAHSRGKKSKKVRRWKRK
jgi:hypothetical protein